MITGPSREAQAGFSNVQVDVSVQIEVSADNAPSIGQVLNVFERALIGALVALGEPSVEASLAVWHEARAVEARESGEF